MCLGLAACGGGTVPDVADRSLRVASVAVEVPQDLRVSRRGDRLIPNADIVWFEDLTSDRYEIVDAIMTEGLEKAAATTSGPSVDVAVEIQRFHALSLAAQGLPGGGWHTIRFEMTVTDSATGAIVDGPRDVAITVDAYGGKSRERMLEQGITVRERIVAGVATHMAREFGSSATFEDPVLPVKDVVENGVDVDI